ncbi:hypothetical protein DM860_013321 [Cuscuta australis]|uniref:Reverse transcriptase zinc-binding domain-containing protein n=1 Tax=Cuscuta australis TaxID=267555 RepID=A0A328DPG9_9ASTE|nr:hypothetical protein DM860_013321 [Cuscuta australis]
MRRETKMSRGVLPFKYLGGPITASRISNRECEALVHKLTNKITVWATKHLSYAERCKLINSVLFGIISLWCKLFVIPGKVMHQIQSICRNFLWGSKAEYSKVPAVGWDDVCRPKKEGGLGIKNLALWNYACNHSLLWDIANKKDVLWVKWIHNKYLKGSSIWDIQPKSGMCYYLRKLLHNRKLFANMGMKGEYETQLGYKWLMGEANAYPEFSIVWNRLTIPKHQVLMWLGWKNRISTKVRLQKFLNIDTGCVLFSNGVEDKEHLFYGCAYTLGIKEEIEKWIGVQWKAKNDADLKRASESVKGRRKRQIMIAGFAAVCYAVWKARNFKIKQEKLISVEESIEWIKFQMRSFINYRLKNVVLR